MEERKKGKGRKEEVKRKEGNKAEKEDTIGC